MTDRDAIAWRTLSTEEGARVRAGAREVLEREPWVIAAYLYGSTCAGVRPARDVDIGIVVKQTPGRSELGRLASALAAAAGLPEAEIDLRVLNGASPVLLNEVLRKGELLCETDHEARMRFEVRAISEWLDFAPVWRRTRERVLRRWSHG